MGIDTKRKFKKVLVAVLFFIIFPFLSLASCGDYTASGFDSSYYGSSIMNGDFTNSGTQNGQPYYVNGSWYLFYYDSTSGYCLHTSLITTGQPNFSYWCTENGTTNPLKNGYVWKSNYTGSHSDGNITICSSGSGSGTTTPNTITTTTLFTLDTSTTSSSTNLNITTSGLTLLNNLYKFQALIASLILVLLVVIISLIVIR